MDRLVGLDMLSTVLCAGSHLVWMIDWVLGFLCLTWAHIATGGLKATLLPRCASALGCANWRGALRVALGRTLGCRGSLETARPHRQRHDESSVGLVPRVRWTMSSRTQSPGGMWAWIGWLAWDCFPRFFAKVRAWFGWLFRCWVSLVELGRTLRRAA